MHVLRIGQTCKMRLHHAWVLVLAAALGAAEPPVRLDAVPAGTTTVTLAWPAAVGADDVVVMRSTTGGGWRAVATLPGSATGWSDTGLVASTLYLYRVDARVAGQVAGRSPPAWAGTGAAVSTATVLQRTHAHRLPGGGVRLAWDHRLGDATGFRIEQQVAAGAWTLAAVAGPSATQAFLADPGITQALNLRVRAEAGSSVGVWSQCVVGRATPMMAGLPVFVTAWQVHAAVTPPSGVAVVRQGISQVQVTWSGVGGAVLRSLDGEAWAEIGGGSGTLTFIDQVWDSPQRYCVVNDGGFSPVIDLPALARDDGLDAPAAVSVNAATTGVDLAWTWTGSGADAVLVERDAALVATLPASARSWHDDAGSIYGSYRIWMRSPAGLGRPGSPLLTFSGPGPAPSGLAVASLTATQANLTWTSPSGYSGRYAVQRSDGGGPWLPLLTTRSTTCSDPTIVPGAAYRYRVGSSGVGSFSSELAVTAPAPGSPPPAVSGLVVVGVSPIQILASWSATGAATGFRVETSPDGTVWTLAAQLPGTDRSFSVTGLAAGTVRQVRVTATNAAGSAAAAGGSATTPASAPSVSAQIRSCPVGGGRILVLTGTAADDDLLLGQNGSAITLAQAGISVGSWAGPFTEVRLLGGTGDDRLRVDVSVTGRVLIVGGRGNDTLEAFGSGPQVVVAVGHGRDGASGREGSCDVWADAADTVTVTATDASAHRVHRLVMTSNGAGLDPEGEDIAEPGIYGIFARTTLTDQTLWGDGPGPLDMHQGNTQDCPTTSLLQGFAWTSPALLQRLAADLGDGTYAVEIDGGFLRIDGQFNLNNLGKTPPSGSLWALLFEKAMIVYNQTLPTWLDGRASDVAWPAGDAAWTYGQIRTALDQGRTVGVFTRSNPLLDFRNGCPNQHAHTILAAWPAADGSTRYLVRNPYGMHIEKLDSPDWRQGLRILTHRDLVDNMLQCSIAGRIDAPATGPVAMPVQASVAAGSSVAIRLTGWDPDGLPITWSITVPPQRGVLTGTPPRLTYTPTGATAGSDTFMVAATSAAGSGAGAPVTIAITGIANQAPQVAAGATAAPAVMALP
jgi:hypothetical protein